MAKKLTEVTIGVRGFTYDKEVNGVTVREYAQFGDTIEVNDKDLALGEREGSFKSEETQEAEESLGGQAVVDLSDDDLDEWLESSSPTVKQVIAAADGDPENAQRLLDAESRVTGDDPRETLVSGLNKIISPEE